MAHTAPLTARNLNFDLVEVVTQRRRRVTGLEYPRRWRAALVGRLNCLPTKENVISACAAAVRRYEALRGKHSASLAAHLARLSAGMDKAAAHG